MTEAFPPLDALLDDLVEAEDLELDFSDAELAKAQEPLLPDSDQSPGATRLLTEAPWPSGVFLGSGGDLEPVVAMAGDASSDLAEDEPRGGPPSFFPRLGFGTAGLNKVEQVSERAWSLASGDSWPVFVQRLHPPRLKQAAWLKRVALAARRHAENRLCLGSSGELDVFFNDRGSLERFQREIFDPLEPPRKSPFRGPVRVMACRGLLGCPWAAVDSLSAADSILEILSGHLWSNAASPGVASYGGSSPSGAPPKRRPLTLTVRACAAGPGLGCGVFEYSDLSLTGRRRGWPAIDQDIASLSPRLSHLIIGCPGKALKRSHLPGVFMELDRGKCVKCGWCVSQDVAFSWPAPQGGYFSLEISGRRQSPPWDYVPARPLWPDPVTDMVEAGARILSLVELWRREAAENEILADFAARRGLLGEGASPGLSGPNAAGQNSSGQNPSG